MRIVRRSVQNLVPKCIVHVLIRGTLRELQQRLIVQIGRLSEEQLSELLVEDKRLVEKRQKLVGKTLTLCISPKMTSLQLRSTPARSLWTYCGVAPYQRARDRDDQDHQGP